MGAEKTITGHRAMPWGRWASCTTPDVGRLAFVCQWGPPWNFEHKMPGPEQKRNRSCSPKRKRSSARGHRATSRDKAESKGNTSRSEDVKDNN